LIFGSETLIGYQQDEEESELTKYDLRNTAFFISIEAKEASGRKLSLGRFNVE